MIHTRERVVHFSARFAFLLIVLGVLVPSAHAQGIHTTLRARMNPYPAYQSYAGVWGDGHYAYVGSERRYGVLIYDISSPSAPALASYYAPSNSYDMEDIKVASGIGYFADNAGSGLHIVDVSDPANPRLISQITSANGGYDNAHKVAVWQNFVFIPDNLHSPAIKVFDVSTPAIPVLKTTILTTDPKWINDMNIQDNGAGSVRLYTSGWGSKTDIWDITNLATQVPTLLGSFTSGASGSSSSATADGNFLACSRKTTDGTSEVKIYNISNPANVTLVSTLTMSALGIDAVAPHDPKIMGNLMYVSWYQAGTLIFDITNPSSPVLIGSYDTWPGAVTMGNLDGNWGVYPYLGQDRVLLSDRNTGLYIVDATGVSAQPALYNFKVNPVSVVGPAPSTATAYLVGLAGADGVVVTLSSNNSVAVAPPSVTIPAGGTRADTTVTTNSVSTTTKATLTATYGTASKSATLTVTPDTPSSLKFSPLSVIGPNSSRGTVTLVATATVDTPVTLTVTSGGSAVASIPGTVTVFAGTSTISFAVATNVVTASTTVKVSATANGASVTGSFTVTPNTPTSVKFSPSSVIGSQSSTGTVSFGSPVITDTTVTLTVASGSAAVASMPGSVTVLAGTTSASWTVVTNPVTSSTSVQISASANGGSKSGTLTVTANTPTSVSFSPNKIIGGASSTGKVSFGLALATDTTVTLTIVSGGSAVASMPSSVVASAGSTSVTFPVITVPVASSTTVQISATANGGSKTGSLTVN